jgi:hypothetical protein
MERDVLRGLVGLLGVSVVALLVYFRTHVPPVVHAPAPAITVTPASRGHFVPDPTPGDLTQKHFDLASAVAVPNPQSRFDCSEGQVVRFDRNGRAVCLASPKKNAPWEDYQDDPLATRGDQCGDDFVKVYDDRRNEYCVPLERVDHLGKTGIAPAPH